MLDRIRRAALPASRTVRATFAGVFAMAMLIVGLLAMHATGSGPEHTAHAAPSAAHHAEPAATGAGDPHGTGHEASTRIADPALDDLGGCALMMLGCGMFAAAVALLMAAAPGTMRGAARALEPVVERLRNPAPPRPPSLVALSISRT